MAEKDSTAPRASCPKCDKSMPYEVLEHLLPPVPPTARYECEDCGDIYGYPPRTQ